MTDQTRAALLAEYRRLQDAEGATMKDELNIAKAQGEAWRAYLAQCRADGVQPGGDGMSAVDRAALIEAAEAVMIREGGRLAEWHGWRCAYPEQYGQCDCNRVVAADIISELLPLIADAIAMSRIEMYDEATPGTVTYDFAVNVKSKAAHLVRSLLSTDNDQ